MGGDDKRLAPSSTGEGARGLGSGWWAAPGATEPGSLAGHPLALSLLPPQPSNSLGTITDEEMKTGDPKETLRRASMQPSQIAAGMATRRSTLAGTIATRQLRKRRSDESHQGPDTPEVS